METTYQLVVTGSNYYYGERQKVTKLTLKEYNEIESVAIAVIHNSQNSYNWCNGTKLVKDDSKPSGWREELLVYDMYRYIPREQLKKFIRVVPNGVDMVRSVELQEIKVNSIKNLVRK